LQKRRDRFLPLLLLWRLSEAYTWSATVLVDQLDTHGLQAGSLSRIAHGRKIGFVSQKNGVSCRLCLGDFRKCTPGPPPFSSIYSCPNGRSPKLLDICASGAVVFVITNRTDSLGDPHHFGLGMLVLTPHPQVAHAS
jgi:hypothetical protein